MRQQAADIAQRIQRGGMVGIRKRMIEVCKPLSPPLGRTPSTVSSSAYRRASEMFAIRGLGLVA
jgi:hypothetical protein